MNTTSRRDFLKATGRVAVGISALSLPIGFTTPVFASEEEVRSFPEGKFSLWQLPSQSPSQMMSYVLRTPAGKILVIDGGCPKDADYLRQFLEPLGNQVHHWILTHPHIDHIGAITALLPSLGSLKIDKMYGSFPDRDWVEKHERIAFPTTESWEAAFNKTGRELIEPEIEDTLDIDGCKITFLGKKNLEIHQNAINNSSLVFRCDIGDTRILFTGDLGVEGGQKLMKLPELKKAIAAEYIQMAHHGQNGVNRAFYEAVAATYALWPTPLWLWDVDTGQGKGSGPWKTLEVRKWMEELGIKENYVSYRGLQRLDFGTVVKK